MRPDGILLLEVPFKRARAERTFWLNQYRPSDHSNINLRGLLRQAPGFLISDHGITLSGKRIGDLGKIGLDHFHPLFQAGIDQFQPLGSLLKNG